MEKQLYVFAIAYCEKCESEITEAYEWGEGHICLACQSEVDEMRMCRREIINYCLHKSHECNIAPIAESIKQFVRYYEVRNYGRELKAYE